jgi:hypothetical protein
MDLAVWHGAPSCINMHGSLQTNPLVEGAVWSEELSYIGLGSSSPRLCTAYPFLLQRLLTKPLFL